MLPPATRGSHWSSLLAGVDADAARSRLEASDGSVRKAAGS